MKWASQGHLICPVCFIRVCACGIVHHNNNKRRVLLMLASRHHTEHRHKYMTGGKKFLYLHAQKNWIQEWKFSVKRTSLAMDNDHTTTQYTFSFSSISKKNDTSKQKGHRLGMYSSKLFQWKISLCFSPHCRFFFLHNFTHYLSIFNLKCTIL